MLIGAGYDVHVVMGLATQATALNSHDQSVFLDRSASAPLEPDQQQDSPEPQESLTGLADRSTAQEQRGEPSGTLHDVQSGNHGDVTGLASAVDHATEDGTHRSLQDGIFGSTSPKVTVLAGETHSVMQLTMWNSRLHKVVRICLDPISSMHGHRKLGTVL